MPDPEFTSVPGAQGPTPEVPQRSRLRPVFIGAQGVRAGWRLLIFILLLVGLSAAVSPLTRRVAGKLGGDFSPRNVIIGEVIAFGILLLTTVIVGRFEHRSLAEYGLPFRLMLRKQFWTGALWGFVMLSFIVAMMAATHAYSPGGLALSAPAIVQYGLLWALGFLMVGFFEEFAMRGYLQFTLTSGLGFWPATAITCTLFALAHRHNPGENWMGVVEIVLIALFLCVALRRTGNLWFAIGWHMSFDWGESFFYSTPNSGIQAKGHLLNASLMGSKWLSGGTVGPEASIFDLIVTIAGILLLAKLYPEAKYPAPQPATPLSPVAEAQIEAAPPAAPGQSD
ncbi:MAG TPA: type II CAAX endopeptidase family protein [Candidatus Binatia bacterium]|nr:type II CAAX endopeptidase family protein [Candidatus Binatia bacterium]